MEELSLFDSSGLSYGGRKYAICGHPIRFDLGTHLRAIAKLLVRRRNTDTAFEQRGNGKWRVLTMHETTVWIQKKVMCLSSWVLEQNRELGEREASQSFRMLQNIRARR